MRKGKQDDKNSTAMREIQSQQPANKKCFDCEQRGPTYVNMTIGSFVCTKCSGLLRGINPPHRIKSISMSTFSNEEVEMMRSKGNAWCAAVWCGSYNKANNPIDFKDDEKIKEFIIAKYEKKRYYVDPSQANFTSIKTQLTGGSTGSGDSHGSYKLSSSSLIGSTLKARVDPSSVLGQSSAVLPPASSVVSRPDFMPQVQVPVPSQVQVQVPAQVQVPVPSQVQVQAPSQSQVPDQSQPQNNQKSENFANFDNFADFDGVAFDSLPSDPLTALPPSRKVSTGPSTPAATLQTSGDKYSALKELDDLFRTSTISEPQPAAPSSQQETGGLFSSNPAPIPNIINQSQHNGIWANSSSPATSTWVQPSSSPMWTPQWSQDTPGQTNTPTWSDSATKHLTPGQNTNPFGTSPSNTTLGQVFSDNNNDLFAAAPKPFISEKPGLTVTPGNPWSNETVSSFTPNMMPAHNPNNPFL
jgi:hypothetical protein